MPAIVEMAEVTAARARGSTQKDIDVAWTLTNLKYDGIEGGQGRRPLVAREDSEGTSSADPSVDDQADASEDLASSREVLARDGILDPRRHTLFTEWQWWDEADMTALAQGAFDALAHGRWEHFTLPLSHPVKHSTFDAERTERVRTPDNPPKPTRKTKAVYQDHVEGTLSPKEPRSYPWAYIKRTTARGKIEWVIERLDPGPCFARVWDPTTQADQLWGFDGQRSTLPTGGPPFPPPTQAVVQFQPDDGRPGPSNSTTAAPATTKKQREKPARACTVKRPTPEPLSPPPPPKRQRLDAGREGDFIPTQLLQSPGVTSRDNPSGTAPLPRLDSFEPNLALAEDEVTGVYPNSFHQSVLHNVQNIRKGGFIARALKRNAERMQQERDQVS